MAVQNRMALDLLLAEKGGSCFMFRERHCTFIPNNTAADESVTTALQGLRTLSTRLKEQSGVANAFRNFMSGFFSRYKGLVFSVLASLSVMVSISVLYGFCCFPCIRSLCEKTIKTAIHRHTQDNNALQLPLMTGNCEFVTLWWWWWGLYSILVVKY